MIDAKRSIWCQTEEAVVYGRVFRKELKDASWWQRLFKIEFEPGTYVEWALADKDQALKAFDLYLESPASFKIDSIDPGSIEFNMQRGDQKVLLGIWETSIPISSAVIPVSEAKNLISFIYDNPHDQIVPYIRSIAHQTT